MAARRNLVLVSNPLINARDDFEVIATKVEGIDPDIAARVVDHVAAWDLRTRAGYHLRRLRLAARPTLVVAPYRHDGFRPLRGVVRTGNRMAKDDEARLLAAADVPVPAQVVWTEHRQPSIDHLGPWVITKPAIGTQAHGVELVAADEVRWRSYEADTVGESTSMIVQEFVDTDPAPSYYRVLTLFGTPLMCQRIRLVRDQAPIRGDDPRRWPILARGPEQWKEMVIDPDVMALAARAAGAVVPEVPLCGVDVVREAGTGRLLVLEMNTWGYVWYLSSPASPADNERFGLDMYGQLGALDRAAERLAAVTRELLG